MPRSKKKYVFVLCVCMYIETIYIYKQDTLNFSAFFIYVCVYFSMVMLHNILYQSIKAFSALLLTMFTVMCIPQ